MPWSARETARRSTFVLFSLLVASCATHRQSTLPALGDDYHSRERVLAGLDDWQVKGRIGIRTADDGFSGSLLWRQRGKVMSASLRGPLGFGALQLDGTEKQLRLARGDGDVVELANPESALAERYGWTVPVGSFRYWVLGIADPRTRADLDVGGEGLLNGLKQGAWRVIYRDYQIVAGEQLPRKLVADNGDVKMTVSIKDWRIPY